MRECLLYERNKLNKIFEINGATFELKEIIYFEN